MDKNYIRSYAIKTRDSRVTDEGTPDPKMPSRAGNAANVVGSVQTVSRLSSLNQ